MICYTTKLISENTEDKEALLLLMEHERLVFNIASKEQYPEKKNSIVVLHSKVYHSTRLKHPEINSNVVIEAERACLSAYRVVKSNKHKINKPIEKVRLSIQLNCHLYKRIDHDIIRITTAIGRKNFKFQLYPKLVTLLDKYQYKDPLIFSDGKDIYISLPFDTKPKEVQLPKLALGIDLGIRRSAALSDGTLIIDRKFNKAKRSLRYLKRKLQAKGTKTARKHLKKLRRKERNKNKDQTHRIANAILARKADAFVLENLKGIKAKKHKFQNKNQISQVPLAELRRVLTYKAENMGKHILLVSPAYTSQIDHATGVKEGERRGCRFYSETGLIYDADVNAAVNIAKRCKLPISYGNVLDGQAFVNRLNVCKSSQEVLQIVERQ